MKIYFLVFSLVLFQLVSSQNLVFNEEASTEDTATLANEIWGPVDPNIVDNNTEIQRALNHGVSSVIELAVERSAMPDDNYDIVGIYNVWKQEATTEVNYRYEVQVMTPDGQIFRIKYDVNVNQQTGALDTYRWKYGPVTGNGWDTEAEFGPFDYLPDEVFLADEHYLNPQEDGSLTLLL